MSPTTPVHADDPIAVQLVADAGDREGGTTAGLVADEPVVTVAEDTLRAIAAGEVDAFVVSVGSERQVFSLATTDRPYRIFVESMREGAATLSSGGVVLYANRRLAELLERPVERIVGAPLTAFLSPGGPLTVEALRGQGEGTDIECDLLNSRGVVVPVLVGTAPLDIAGDELICMTFTDLTAQRAQEHEIARLSHAQTERLAELQGAQDALTRQATHDALTGLPNRALLIDRIEAALALSRRSGRCTAVLFVDLDRFKRINDSKGHAAGDVVLRRVAGQLLSVLRPMDTVARIGGDEFIILAPEVDNQLHAADIGARIVTELSRIPQHPDSGELVGASVGISVSLDGQATAEILINEADTAMYHAKSSGGERCAIFDASLGRLVDQRAVTQEILREALSERRILVHYQPIIDLDTGTISGFEALARIAERDGSIVPPSTFIPVAEDRGLVIPLGAAVVDIACREASRWRPKGGRRSPLTIAVNVSSRQFEPGDLVDIVQRSLQDADLAPDQLLLELTETAIIDLRPRTLNQLGELRELGVQIGLDDFGTGYASLTHLRRLPLTFIKIDQSFVQGLGTNRDDDQIVAAVIDLAENLGLRSIGEGVETPEQLRLLREHGCDQAQGYLFARPMPSDDIPTVLAHSRW
jgi:diguanylate cyclase (GGDEF)-like protein